MQTAAKQNYIGSVDA